MEAEEQIRRVVHGLAHWSSLREHGFELSLEGSAGQRRWISGSCPCQVTMRAEDLLEGIQNLQSEPASLSEWAFFLLGSDSVDFAGLDESPRDEALRDIVWRLGFDEPLESMREQMAIARRDEG
jgi:hypothetical protein